jgi:hypothetical protein
VSDPDTGQPVCVPVTEYFGPVTCIEPLDLDGRPVLISGSADGSLLLSDLATG